MSLRVVKGQHAFTSRWPDEEAHRKLADHLYETYCVPLEAEHLGKFVAVTSDGHTFLGQALADVTGRAMAECGMPGYVFKLGPRVIGRVR